MHKRQKKKDAETKPAVDPEARLALRSGRAETAFLIGRCDVTAKWRPPELRSARFRVHFRFFDRRRFCSVILSVVVLNTDVIATGMPEIISQITGSCAARKTELMERNVVRVTYRGQFPEGETRCVRL